MSHPGSQNSASENSVIVDDQSYAKRPSRKSYPAAKKMRTTRAPKTVLQVVIVENMIDHIELYRDILQLGFPDISFEVHPFTNGDEAYHFILSRKGEVDLLITDNAHRGIFGIRLVRRVKLRFQHIKTALISASFYAGIPPGAEVQAYVDLCLAKPLNIIEFLPALGRLIGYRRLRMSQ